jgi:hypothetical protein
VTDGVCAKYVGTVPETGQRDDSNISRRKKKVSKKKEGKEQKEKARKEAADPHSETQPSDWLVF